MTTNTRGIRLGRYRPATATDEPDSPVAPAFARRDFDDTSSDDSAPSDTARAGLDGLGIIHEGNADVVILEEPATQDQVQPNGRNEGRDSNVERNHNSLPRYRHYPPYEMSGAINDDEPNNAQHPQNHRQGGGDLVYEHRNDVYDYAIPAGLAYSHRSGIPQTPPFQGPAPGFVAPRRNIAPLNTHPIPFYGPQPYFPPPPPPMQVIVDPMPYRGPIQAHRDLELGWRTPGFPGFANLPMGPFMANWFNRVHSEPPRNMPGLAEILRQRDELAETLAQARSDMRILSDNYGSLQRRLRRRQSSVRDTDYHDGDLDVYDLDEPPSFGRR